MMGYNPVCVYATRKVIMPCPINPKYTNLILGIRVRMRLGFGLVRVGPNPKSNPNPNPNSKD